MSNNIKLKRGLDLPLSGVPALETRLTVVPDVLAIKPTDFKSFVPRLLVREGDRVLAGSPVLADKQHPEILVTSPLAGTVCAVVRGEKRKLLQVCIAPDGSKDAVDFGRQTPDSLDAAKVKELLLASGLWMSLVQRPYGIIADTAVTPRDIFISTFSTAPLAADTGYTLADDFNAFQSGVDALGKLAPVTVCAAPGSQFVKTSGARVFCVSGRHPAGNPGIQIANIAPIQKGQTVWTVKPELVVAIGRLIQGGKLDLRRKIAVGGPKAIAPCYIDAVPGIPVKALSGFIGAETDGIRVVSGDVLTGENVGADGFLGWFDTQVTILEEGTEREILGWAKPFRFGKFSATRTYFDWLLPKRTYDMNTNTNGGLRAFVVSDLYSKVLPADIFPVYLIKACLAGDIENMEKFGIYEMLPEDLALCEYIDPSKNNIQEMIQKGIDLMIKEMA